MTSAQRMESSFRDVARSMEPDGRAGIGSTRTVPADPEPYRLLACSAKAAGPYALTSVWACFSSVLPVRLSAHPFEPRLDVGVSLERHLEHRGDVELGAHREVDDGEVAEHVLAGL